MKVFVQTSPERPARFGLRPKSKEGRDQEADQEDGRSVDDDMEDGVEKSR